MAGQVDRSPKRAPHRPRQHWSTSGASVSVARIPDAELYKPGVDERTLEEREVRLQTGGQRSPKGV